MEYKINISEKLDVLAQVVQYDIHSNWKPQGGIFVIPETRESLTKYGQAMVREFKKETGA